MKLSRFCKLHKKEPDKIQMSFHIYTSSGSGRYDCSYADSLSTNLFSVEADSNDRFADRAFNFNDPLYCLRVRIKQPFIFTTWTSHMHFLHIFSPPARGQPKGNVKLTVGDCFIFLCTVCRDLNPMAAINIVYRTYVLLSTNFVFTRKPWRSFYSVEIYVDLVYQFLLFHNQCSRQLFAVTSDPQKLSIRIVVSLTCRCFSE